MPYNKDYSISRTVLNDPNFFQILLMVKEVQVMDPGQGDMEAIRVTKIPAQRSSNIRDTWKMVQYKKFMLLNNSRVSDLV